MMKQLACIALCTITIKSLAQKTEPIQLDRPDQTETPMTVPEKHFQMEIGFAYEHTNAQNKAFAHPSTLMKYGLTSKFEVGVITEFNTFKSTGTTGGLSPVSFRIKQKITEEKGIIPVTSFIGYLSLPWLASKELKATYYAPAFRFTMQHTLSDKVSLGYNAGAEWDGVSAEPVFIYTLTTGLAITEKLAAFAEIYGFAPQMSKADHRFDAGFSYLLKNNVAADVSGGVGISKNAPDYFLSCGFSFRLKD